MLDSQAVLPKEIVGRKSDNLLEGSHADATPTLSFHPDIERGKVLMMVDVPMRRVQEISDLVAKRHPEAVSGGFEPTIPAFP